VLKGSDIRVETGLVFVCITAMLISIFFLLVLGIISGFLSTIEMSIGLPQVKRLHTWGSVEPEG